MPQTGSIAIGISQYLSISCGGGRLPADTRAPQFQNFPERRIATAQATPSSAAMT